MISKVDRQSEEAEMRGSKTRIPRAVQFSPATTNILEEAAFPKSIEKPRFQIWRSFHSTMRSPPEYARWCLSIGGKVFSISIRPASS